MGAPPAIRVPCGTAPGYPGPGEATGAPSGAMARLGALTRGTRKVRYDVRDSAGGQPWLDHVSGGRLMNTDELVELAQQLRVDAVRAAEAAGSGHPTSSMSAADLMAVLLAHHFRYDFDRP